MTTAADLLVECLAAEGVTYIFGVPGEENADFLMSLEKSDIRFVLTRHEQGAAFMAGTYGRLTGNPAVCLGTLGPGSTNLITGVADANMDRTPMLVITGQASTSRRHKESHQVMDVVEMYRPVTKWNYSIENPDTIPEIVRKAVRLARAEKPGATHIELPEDVARRATMMRPMPPRRFRRPVPDDEIVDTAWDEIRAARRPIIIAGNGTIRKRASKQLRRFCDRTEIGVLSTFMGKGSVDCDASYCLFSIGLQGQDWATLAVEDADLVITIGYDLVEYPPEIWNPDATAKVLHIDFEPTEIDANYNPEVEIVGDIAHALWMLNERAERDGVPAFDLAGQRRMRETMLDEFREFADDDTPGPVKPQRAVREARRALGKRDLLLSGVGAHKMWVGRYFQCHEPNTCLIPNGFCAMGMPLPGGIGAWLVDSDRRILGIVGDGDFLMNVQEMETARRLSVDMTMMIWVDNAYGLIEWKQLQDFERHTELSFSNPDWLELAGAFGWTGWVVDGPADLAPALSEALSTPGPSLVAVPIDYRENEKLSKRLGRLESTL